MAQWTIKEKLLTPLSHREVWVPVWSKHNLMTDYGLTALASAFGGTYVAPLYLVLDTKSGQITNATLAAGSTSVSLNNSIHRTGDTQLVLGVSTANEEVVSFSAVTGTGPFVYTISATTKTHVTNDYCVRQPRQADTLASMTSEAQYDSVNFPGKRVKSNGFYSSGTGNGTMTFFLTGSQAIFRWESLGTSENQAVGAGNLHNRLAVGYSHVAGNDTQLDISLTLTN